MVKMAFQPWEYRPDAGFAVGTDLIGYTVVAVDGDIGHVEATYDSRPAYLEVDVGSFFGGREVMVPAGLVERIDSAKKKVYVDRTRDQIKDAPRYDQAPADYWERLGSYYSGTYMPPGDQM
jgi:PRC-barrel domain